MLFLMLLSFSCSLPIFSPDPSFKCQRFFFSYLYSLHFQIDHGLFEHAKRFSALFSLSAYIFIRRYPLSLSSFGNFNSVLSTPCRRQHNPRKFSHPPPRERTCSLTLRDNRESDVEWRHRWTNEHRLTKNDLSHPTLSSIFIIVSYRFLFLLKKKLYIIFEYKYNI